MKLRSLLIAFSSSATLLVGCGGGGVSGSPPSVSAAAAKNLPSAPGESAMAAYLQAAHKYAFKATNGGNSYTLHVSRVPNAGTTKFDGSAPAYSTLESVTLDENGLVIAANSSTDYFLLSPYVPLGRVSGSGSPYGVVTSSSPLPATLDVGFSGDLESLTYYHDPTLSTVDGDEGVTYTVKANNPTTLLFCLDSSVTNVTAQGTADDLVDDAEIDCYRVDAAGNSDLLSVTLTVNGRALTFE
jgi:hypothetical protein